jgi:mono/diheme cytochrome c family protein
MLVPGRDAMKVLLTLLIITLLSACSMLPDRQSASTPIQKPGQGAQPGMMQGMGSGIGMGMMGRHHAAIPVEYAEVSSTYPADDASIGRGQQIYSQHCVSCHGESGMGDGPAGASLDPPPSPIAHTSQMLADNYLFWRLSEGGAAFQTSMPAWKEILNEGQRWDVLHYVRALGQDGAAAVATAQAARQREMLKQAVESGVISQAEADTFRTVHDSLEGFLKLQTEKQGNMDEREAAALQALVDAGQITQEQVQAFRTIHDKLAEAGLMP